MPDNRGSDNESHFNMHCTSVSKAEVDPCKAKIKSIQNTNIIRTSQQAYDLKCKFVANL